MVDLRQQIKPLTIRIGGRSPFTKEIWSGKTRPGLELAYNQFFRVFSLVCSNELSLWPQVKPELPPGETYHFVEAATALDLPTTVPLGHTLFTFSTMWQPDTIAKMRFLTDGFLVFEGTMETLITTYSFSSYILGTDIVDPLGEFEHPFDLTITNIGDRPLTGQFAFICVETIVGSAFSDTKTVKCKHCGFLTKKVKNEATRVTCNKCGKTTFYYPIIRGGRIG